MSTKEKEETIYYIVAKIGEQIVSSGEQKKFY